MCAEEAQEDAGQLEHTHDKVAQEVVTRHDVSAQQNHVIPYVGTHTDR